MNKEKETNLITALWQRRQIVCFCCQASVCGKGLGDPGRASDIQEVGNTTWTLSIEFVCRKKRILGHIEIETKKVMSKAKKR
jgi:hypothetical protein